MNEDNAKNKCKNLFTLYPVSQVMLYPYRYFTYLFGKNEKLLILVVIYRNNSFIIPQNLRKADIESTSFGGWGEGCPHSALNEVTNGMCLELL